MNGVNEWEDVATITDNPKKPAYVDTGLQPNTAYQYRIIALGFLETSGSLPSKVSKTVTTAPAAPENLTVTKVEHNLAVLAWDAVAGATSYKVEKFINGKWSSGETNAIHDTYPTRFDSQHDFSRERDTPSFASSGDDDWRVPPHSTSTATVCRTKTQGSSPASATPTF